MKKIPALLSAALSLLLLSSAIFPLSSAASAQTAGNLTASAEISVGDVTAADLLRDGKNGTCVTLEAGQSVSVKSKEKIAYLYLKFYHNPAKYSVSSASSGALITKDEPFLQDVADLAGLPTDGGITVTFPEGAEIAELEIYSAGTLPESVHLWKPPAERADLVVFSTHADDEQLFFGAAIAYAVSRGAAVQVCYVVDHGNPDGYCTPERAHEQLEGLWTLGIRNYPVPGRFPDLYSLSYDDTIYQYRRLGVSLSAIVGYEVECIRRFHPQVVLTHDLEGEYGHGQHRVTAHALTLALGYAESETDFPATYGQYGTWSVSKAYFHLYETNPVVLDIDTPLEAFGGLTAFQTAQNGFLCHKTQTVYWFYEWQRGTKEAPITKASQIEDYNPAKYGLYRSLVGPDSGNDLFEHITFYADTPPDTSPAETTAPVPPETTVPVTEPVTVPETEPETEPVTTPAGSGETGKAPEPDTSGTAEPSSAPETEPPSPSDEPDVTTVSPPEESSLPAPGTSGDDGRNTPGEKGCGNALTSASLLLLPVMIAVPLISRKRGTQ